MADESTSLVESAAMSFGEHLEDLRSCLIRALIGIALAACVTLAFGKEIVSWLCQPLWYAQRSMGLTTQIEFLNPTASLTIYLKVSFIAAVIVAAPWVTYQAWRFVSAGLYASEKRVAYYLMPLSSLMCALGVMFAYYVMIPVTLLFFFNFAGTFPEAGPAQPTVIDKSVVVIKQLLGYDAPPAPVTTADAAPPEAAEKPALEALSIPQLAVEPESPIEGQMWINTTVGELHLFIGGRVLRAQLIGMSTMSPRISGDEYISFVTMTGLGIVVAFQLPVVMLIVGWLGIITAADLAKARKYCVFGCFIVGAVLTPQDVLSMFLLAIPLILLFEMGLILMRLTGNRRT